MNEHSEKWGVNDIEIALLILVCAKHEKTRVRTKHRVNKQVVSWQSTVMESEVP